MLNLLYLITFMGFLLQTSTTFSTVSIFNKEYVATFDWGDIPVSDKRGEDINSKYFGELYYPLLVRGTDQHEKRLSVASGYMEIEVDLPIPESQVYELQYLSVKIVNTYNIAADKYEKGIWKIGSRASEYRPYVDITGEESLITEPVEDVIFGQENGNTFICEVSIDDGEASENKLFEFQIILDMIDADNSDEQIRMVSDKHYFLSGK